MKNIANLRATLVFFARKFQTHFSSKIESPIVCIFKNDHVPVRLTHLATSISFDPFFVVMILVRFLEADFVCFGFPLPAECLDDEDM